MANRYFDKNRRRAEVNRGPGSASTVIAKYQPINDDENDQPYTKGNEYSRSDETGRVHDVVTGLKGRVNGIVTLTVSQFDS